MVTGVCGGLGRYFDVNPAYYRVGFVILALLGGAGILIYVAALLVMPNEGEDDSVASDILRNHRQHPWALIALAVVAVAALSLLSHATLWPNGDAAWIFLIVGGGIILWIRRTEAGKRPRILRTVLITLGTIDRVRPHPRRDLRVDLPRPPEPRRRRPQLPPDVVHRPPPQLQARRRLARDRPLGRAVPARRADGSSPTSARAASRSSSRTTSRPTSTPPPTSATCRSSTATTTATTRRSRPRPWSARASACSRSTRTWEPARST